MAKKTERQGFVLYHDIRKPLELLDDAQRGKLFLAILDYSEHGLLPDFDDAVIDMAFAFISQVIDNGAEAWEESRRRRAEAGSKGGKKKAENQANVAMLSNATNATENVANVAMLSKCSKHEHELKHEHEPEHELEQEKKKRKRFTPPTLEEVKAYCEQRHSSVDPVQFFEYFTADPDRQWIDAKGNKVTNWKAKILTWEKFDTKPAAQTAPRMNKTEQLIASMRNENHTHTADEMNKLLAAMDKL